MTQSELAGFDKYLKDQGVASMRDAMDALKYSLKVGQPTKDAPSCPPPPAPATFSLPPAPHPTSTTPTIAPTVAAPATPTPIAAAAAATATAVPMATTAAAPAAAAAPPPPSPGIEFLNYGKNKEGNWLYDHFEVQLFRVVLAIQYLYPDMKQLVEVDHSSGHGKSQEGGLIIIHLTIRSCQHQQCPLHARHP
jgi:hypothetical protein